jgi:hypothetical protein
MTNTKPTPRDLDPKFKDAEVPDDQANMTESDDQTTLISYRETYMDGGVQKERWHGPMPIDKWLDYQKENGL